MKAPPASLHSLCCALLVLASACVSSGASTPSGPCSDQCPDVGVAACRGAEALVCRLGDGCLSWVAAATCANGCEGGACQSAPPCSDGCPATGASACQADTALSCEAAGGCRDWATVAECSRGCLNGLCVGPGNCQDECPAAGVLACRGSDVMACAPGDTCLTWATIGTCATGCIDGRCQGTSTCAGQCTQEGATRCSGDSVQVCGRGDGCLQWADVASCRRGCADGKCLRPPCTPACDGRTCGDDDGCGGKCTTCPEGSTCNLATSSCSCTPSCLGRTCGDDDGCGGKCTSCPSNATCNLASPACECPGPTCGGACCVAGQVCGGAGGTECAGCVPSCDTKSCGDDDGCGGKCTTCPANATCNLATPACECQGATTLCDGACVDLATDAKHCNDCKTPCADTDVCVDSKCEPRENGSSCARGFTMTTPHFQSAQVYIDVPGRAWWYRLTPEAGHFYEIRTLANPTLKPDLVDTAMTLWGQEGTVLVASTDDGVPKLGMDSTLIWHAPDASPLCVKVEEFSSWNGVTPKADPATPIRVLLTDYSATHSDGRIEELEPDDTATTATPITKVFSGIFSQFFGVLSTLSDVDVFRVPNLAGFTNHYLVLAPSGTGNGATRKTGYGSTLSVAPVTVTSVDGTVVLASLDFIDQDSLLYVPAAAGQDVLVWIRRAPGAAAVGANDFYSVWHNLDENAQFQDEGESAPGQNDTPATAQELGTNGAYTATHIIVTVLGTLLSPSDVDWYRLDVTFPGTGGPSRYLALRCFGAGMGSGLRWATFALYGPDGTTVLQQETETAAKGVIWDGDPAVAQAADASKPGVAVTAAETWYLRVSTSGQAPDIAGNYYHCDVYLPQ